MTALTFWNLEQSQDEHINSDVFSLWFRFYFNFSCNFHSTPWIFAVMCEILKLSKGFLMKNLQREWCTQFPHSFFFDDDDNEMPRKIWIKCVNENSKWIYEHEKFNLMALTLVNSFILAISCPKCIQYSHLKLYNNRFECVTLSFSSEKRCFTDIIVV